MHCASLGEFEQGRPVLERIRKDFPQYKILLTFFSPSGYEIIKNYTGADLVYYLPVDSKKNAVTFLETVNPTLIIFVKYEFWFHYLNEAKKKNIPVLLISAIFRKEQAFFQWYGSLHRYMLSCFRKIFVQNDSSKKLLANIGLNDNITISGDSRFDRVAGLIENFEPIPLIKLFTGKAKSIVAGSTWKEDEEILQQTFVSFPGTKLIIAPHEIHQEHLQELKKLFPGAVFFSQLQKTNENHTNANCLIIDNIGMLSRLYNYADITYVGGGFSKSGIHNILEAAVYGKPVLFGPNYSKFNEAVDLIKSGAAISIKNSAALKRIFEKLLTDEDYYQSACSTSADYVKDNKGATKKIMDYIQENRLLTS